MTIDLKRIPDWQKEVIEEIKKHTLTTPESMILMLINIKASQYLQIPRIKIISPEDQKPTLCNYYGLLFSRSGTGKDRVLKTIDNLFFSGCKSYFNEKVQEFLEKEFENIQNKLNEFTTKSAQDNYKLKHQPRQISLSFSDGTPEGFIAQREAYNKAGWGGTTFINSELVNYLKQKDKVKGFLISLIGESFDHGNNSAKVTKGNSNCVSVDGVPSTLLASSSPADIHKDNIFEDILESLNRQLARRSFICFPDDSEFKKLPDNVDDIINHFKQNDNDFVSSVYSKKFRDIIIKLDIRKDVVYKLSPKAQRIYFEYFQKCNILSESFYNIKTEGLATEILGRPWKMIKLAGILHSFKYNKYTETICEGTINEAIYQTEVYGRYFNKFYSFEKTDDLTLLYDFFIKNKNKEIMKKDIRELKIVNNNRFSKWFDNILPELKELVLQDGLIIEEANGARNSIYYVLKEIV